MRNLARRKLAVGTVVLALACCWLQSAGAAPLSVPLTLRQCIAEALRNSPGLAASHYDIAAARNDIVKKRGTTLPLLSSKLDAYEVNGAPVTPFSVLNINSPENPISRRDAHWDPVATQSIDLTYPLFQNGSVMGLNNAPVVAAANTMLGQQELTALLTEQKVVLDVFTAFSYAVWYRDALALDEEMVNLSHNALDIVQEQVSLGLKLPQDVDLAKAQLLSSQQAAASARQNARDANRQLGSVMGRKGDYELVLDDAKQPLPQLQPLENFLDRLMRVHPALQVQQGKVEIARQQLRIDRASVLPTVSLNASFMGGENLEHFNGGDNHRNPTAFLTYIEVAAPLFDFGQRRAAIHESEDVVSSARENVKQLELELRGAITQLYSQIYDSQGQMAALRQECVKAGNDAQLARAQRAEGLIDALKLTDSELALRGAQLALEAEGLSQRLRFAELQNLSGGMWRWVR